MLKPIVRTLVLVMTCGVAVAAQSHALRSTWRAPGVESFDFSDQKVAAVVISDDNSLRVSGEEALATPMALYRLKKDTVRPLDRQDADALRERFNLTEDE